MSNGKDKDKDKGKDKDTSESSTTTTTTITTTTDDIQRSLDKLPVGFGHSSESGKPSKDEGTEQLTKRVDALKKATEAAEAAAKRDANARDALNKTANALKDMSRQIGVAVNAFKAGDNITGSGAVMDMLATVMGVIGTVESAAGPAGALLGALFGLLAMIMRAFAPPQKSLTAQIEGMLREVLGQEHKHEVMAAITEYNSSYVVIADKVLHGKVMTEEQMHMYCPIVGSSSALYLYAANDWLENKDNQRQADRSWQAVLEANLHAIELQVRNYSSALLILEPAARHSIYKGYVEIIKAHLASLNNLEKAVRDKALLWYLGLKQHPSVKRVEQEESKNLEGEAVTFSAARVAGSDVALIFTLEEDGSSIDPGKPFPPFPRHKRTYVRSVGPEFDGSSWTQIEELNGLLDIHALPGKENGDVLLYTSAKGWSGVYRYKFNEEDKAQRLKRLVVNGRLNWGLNIRGVPEAKEAATYYLLRWNEKDAYHIQTSDGKIFGVPWNTGSHGIATCKTFLWAFFDRGIAYITHEEAKNANGSAPWRKLPQVPVQASVDDKLLPGGTFSDMSHVFSRGPVIMSLSACDDQVLTAVFLWHVWTTSWKKKDDGSVEIDGWKQLDTSLVPRVQRMPVKVWPVYEEQRKALKKIIAEAPTEV